MSDQSASIPTTGAVGSSWRQRRAVAEPIDAALHSGTVTVEVLVPVLPCPGTLVERAVRLELRGSNVPLVTVEDLMDPRPRE